MLVLRNTQERMKTRLKLALAVLAGVSIGVYGAVAIHAQQRSRRAENRSSQQAAFDGLLPIRSLKEG
jgi:malonyl CoA-acyl carrier protein transacylase